MDAHARNGGGDPYDDGDPDSDPYGDDDSETGTAAVKLTVSQQKYLAAGKQKQDMHAILTVEVEGVGGAAGPGPGSILAQVLVIDCSSSMNAPPEKFRAAKAAAIAALRMLPDDTPFAVVRGAHDATMAYPATPTMVRATPRLRAEAERAVHGLLAAGGTAVGTWLDLTRRLLTEQPAPIRHALLLTDGRNEHDERMPLAWVLDRCEGQFICDGWGIGSDWDAQVLLQISSRLHGASSAVRKHADLPGEYERLMRGLLAKAVPELVIEVAPRPGNTVRYLKQVEPTEVSLVDTGPEKGPSAFVTRAWGNELRRYQLCVSADPTGRRTRVDLQLAVVGVAMPAGGEALLPTPLPCLVHWTDDPALSSRTDNQNDFFSRHLELGKTLTAASDAFRRDEKDRSEQLLGKAVQLAQQVNDQSQLAKLRRLVEVLDATAGRVKLHPGLKPVDFQHLITASSRSAFPGSSGGETEAPPDVTAPCPSCGEPVATGAKFCTYCGARKAAAT
ncbi:VWA domain-containing protein [Streptomyces sp. NBC_00370]|uniref:VWA domain-containing protein n=1 Tax=Streptomyces sp. NBC_00370 TaxID=2975728 RepID=UPI002E252358